MPQIQWAVNSYQARALPLSAQQIVNLYAEAAPKDAKSPVVLYGTPGIKSFCDCVGDGPIRGMEGMDGVLYVVSGDVLYSVAEDCTLVALGSIGVGADSTSSQITGASGEATASFEVTGGSAGAGNEVTSITVGGFELLQGAVPWATSNAATALAITTQTVSNLAPLISAISSTNRTPEGSFSDITITTPAHSAGNMLFAQIGRTDGALDAFQDGTISPAENGWTPIVEDAFSKSDTGSAACRTVGCVMSLYWRVATDNEPSDYTWNYDTVNSPHAIGSIATIQRQHPTDPFQATVESLISLCGQFNRAFTILPPVATTAKTMTVFSLAVSEKFMASGSPLGFAWGTEMDEFKGPLTTSLQLQMFSQNSNLVAGEQWAAEDLVHDDLVGNINQLGVVGVALSISPVVTGVKDDPGGYVLTVDGNTVTITAPANTGANPNGFEVMITTTGDVTVSC